ncbi:hypothetical protein ACSBR2_029182 [Camellia fascicularis]
MCGISLSEACTLAYDGELDIPGLICHFLSIGDRCDFIWWRHRQHTLCLCLLAHYLLASSSGRVSIRLVEMTQCIREGKSYIGLVLAETFMGLDAFRRHETT